MKILCIAIITSLLLVSCKKENETMPFSEAGYIITITGKWSTPEFSVPGGAHFTTFVGMIHNSNAYLWKQGVNASPGTELLAETGNGTMMLTEIDSMIAARNASSLMLFIALPLAGSQMTSIYCNTNYSYVSFASMLGPTPDWFTGITGFNLYQHSNWVTDTTVDLYVYDAGTEEGNIFGYNNPATIPQQNIQLLSASAGNVLANGNFTFAPIATVRFRRQ